MRTFNRSVLALGRDEAGAAGVMVALMMPVLAGMAAFSVDVLSVYTQHEQLRTVAEAAATAAVARLPDRSMAHTAALAYASVNAKGADRDRIVGADDIQIGYWDKATRQFTPTANNGQANAIRITASRTVAKGNPQPTFFGQVFGVSAFDAVEVSAVAARFDGYPCLNALAPDGIGFKVNSNAKIDVKDCAIHVHSAAGNALSSDSNSKIAVVDSEICVKGGYQARSNSKISPAPDTNCTPVQDPFASVPPPSYGACKPNNNPIGSNSNVTLSPGVYCGGITINSNATVKFLPGEYIIKDGRFIVNSNVKISGTGVGFYLTGSNALLDFNSNSEISFTAPSSGPLAGFVFFQDRNFGGQHILNSNSAAMLDGAIYFPKGMLLSNSNSQLGSMSTCLMIVAYRFDFNSNSGVKTTPDYTKCPTPANTRKSRIVA